MDWYNIMIYEPLSSMQGECCLCRISKTIRWRVTAKNDVFQHGVRPPYWIL